MVTEDYCSFELSKLLKEKGFDEECDWFYEEVGDLNRRTRNGCDKYINSLLDYGEYAAPTHQMAMKWLREVHKLHIDIDPSEGDWSPCVIELENWSSLTGGEIAIQDTYEEAIEAALKYSLENLIK